ncbi:MAG: RNA polymerase sigma factor, partial [Acidobacteriota bacterium]|nr:RNA polymerase sigma factor [Acidobacteriota bacterium]
MEEKELIQLSQQGNDEAFEALVKKYQRKVFQLAFSITQDRTNADDIAQEVFLKAYIYLPKFKFKSSLGTWLYQITVNHVKDYFRKTKKIKLISLEDTQELASNKEDEMTLSEKR